MLKKMAQRVKEQKGLTLIELLAVVVILGIIAAIAVPSIGGLIDNSKKDAHVANAQQMISSAKIWVTGNTEEIDDSGKILSLQDLYELDLIDNPIKDPDNNGYTAGEAEAEDDSGSFVKITKSGNKYLYEVKLVNSERGIWQLESGLKRSNVTKKGTLPTGPTES